ncbi:MAG TPA: DUF1565 domain-containing protein [Chloroflexi bacterium]|nr:DUF1565 domain-containing protein [Chloroflexota bacterium]
MSNLTQKKYWLRTAFACLSLALLFIGSWGIPKETFAQGNTCYVAPAGSDSNPGTKAQPWQTIQKAANTLAAGDTVYIRAGTYAEQVTPLNSGSAGSYITYAAYSGETAPINGGGYYRSLAPAARL